MSVPADDVIKIFKDTKTYYALQPEQRAIENKFLKKSKVRLQDSFFHLFESIQKENEK